MLGHVYGTLSFEVKKLLDDENNADITLSELMKRLTKKTKLDCVSCLWFTSRYNIPFPCSESDII